MANVVTVTPTVNGSPDDVLVIVRKADRTDMGTFGDEVARQTVSTGTSTNIDTGAYSGDVYAEALYPDTDFRWAPKIRDFMTTTVV